MTGWGERQDATPWLHRFTRALGRFGLAAVRGATPFAFARVLAWSAAGLATALSLALVLALAGVFTGRVISRHLKGRAGMARRARGRRAHGKGSGEETCQGCTRDDCSGWFHMIQ